MRLQDSENITFSSSILHDCQAGKHPVPTEAQFQRDGLLELVRCKRVSVTGCQILDGVPHGLFIDASEGVQITGCTITDTREPKLMKEAVHVTAGTQPALITGSITK